MQTIRPAATLPAKPAEESGLLVLETRSDINGINVGALGGNSVATVVVFFATWCEPCRKELRILHEIRKTQPGFRVIGVNTYEEWEDLSDQRHLRAFLSVSAPWLRTVVHGDPALIAAFGNVRQIPTMFVYNRNNRIVGSFRRARRALPTKQEISEAVKLALGNTQP